jgi:putative ABC transport system permease protein
VSTATLDKPAAERPAGGGLPARRAVVRWAIRLARREWRQQLLIFALITVTVAATFIGSAVATTTRASATGVLGSAQYAAALPGTGAQVSAQAGALQAHYGRVDVTENQPVSVPGSVATFDLRAQGPHGRFGQPLLSLVSGRYPAAAGQVAVTSGVVSAFHLRVGQAWTVNGVTRTITGIVENPQSLLDEFALVIPGQVTRPDGATARFNAPGASPAAIAGVLGAAAGRPVPAGDIADAASLAASNPVNPETISLAAAVLGMVLIALVSVGGFSVLAQRRLRAIGMLAAQGATGRHIRLVIRANGAATGVAGAVAGVVIGFGGWLAYRPVAQASAHHVIGVFQLPWTVIVVSMALAILAAYLAASRPARTVSRVPVVAALAGRPPAPRKAGRLVVPVGLGFLVLSFLLLGVAGAAAGAAGGGGGEALQALAVGLVLLAVAVIMLAPTTLGAVAWLGRGAPISVRLALRDLSRYRARSGPALAAIALATLIAVIVCVESAGRLSNALDYAGPNLTASQLAIYPASAPAPRLTPAQQARLTPAQQARLTPTQRARLNAQAAHAASPAPPTASQAGAARQIARSLGNARLITLDTAGAALTRAAGGRNWDGAIYVATPQLLRLFGISPAQVRPDADFLTMRPGLAALSLMQLQYGAGDQKGFGGGPPGNSGQYPCPAATCVASPPIQEVSQLPSGTSAPNTVVTEHAVRALHLGSTVTVAGWLIQAPANLTAADIRNARQAAAAAGLSVESRNDIPSLSTIVDDATAFGILLALAILGMSVGLVRSEAGRDLRTLSAAGASGTTRRILVATTAGALGFTGALIGAAGGYLAAIGFARSNQLDALSSLDSIPVANLLLILVGMPLIAVVVSWLLTLREPSAIGRQPLE